MRKDQDHATRDKYKKMNRDIYLKSQYRYYYYKKQFALQIPKMKHYLKNCIVYDNYYLVTHLKIIIINTLDTHLNRYNATKQKKLNMLLKYTIFVENLSFNTFNK